MAVSPRNELVIESVVVFGKFAGGWVWAERTPDGSAEIDSAERSFLDLNDAIEDFFADRGIDLDTKVDAWDAHYARAIRSGEDEYHIRKYKHGAPDPLQAVN